MNIDVTSVPAKYKSGVAKELQGTITETSYRVGNYINPSRQLVTDQNISSKEAGRETVEGDAIIKKYNIYLPAGYDKNDIDARYDGLCLNTDWVLQGDWSMESGKVAMRKLLKKRNIPTAIFAANDAMAIGAIIKALDSGLSVPEDISIVGFDNIDQAIYFRPSLTTVAIDYNLMSRSACMLMFDMIENQSDKLNVNIYVPLSLIDRESTREVETVEHA